MSGVYVVHGEFSYDVMIFNDNVPISLIILCSILVFAIIRPFLKLNRNVFVLHQNRNNSIVIEVLLASIWDLMVKNIRFTASATTSPTKTSFVTIKSLIDAGNSSNTIQQVLNYTMDTR